MPGPKPREAAVLMMRLQKLKMQPQETRIQPGLWPG
jgi:hypothetical protein